MNTTELIVIALAIVIDLFVIGDKKKRIKKDAIEMPEFLAFMYLGFSFAYLLLIAMAIHIKATFIPYVILLLALLLFGAVGIDDMRRNKKRIMNKYGRTLAYVFLSNKTMFEEELLKSGMAEVLTIEPNSKYASFFQCIEDEAKRSGSGFWSE